MGQSTSAIKYSELVGEAKKGETPSIRNIQLHGSDPKEVLYPGMETMLDYFKNSVKKYGNEICIYTKKILSPAVDKTPAKVAIGTITYKQEKTEVKNLARGILKLGLASEVDSDIKGEKIRPLGVFANTREEWFSLIIATWYSGTTSVPLYSTLGKPGIKYIMMESQFSTLFIADELCKTFIDFYKENKIEYLKNIVLFDEKSKKIFDDAKLELNVYTYNQIKEIGAAAKDVKFPKINSGSIDTICYTSGTTGVPKGVVTTQKMLVAYITGLLVVDFLSVIDHNYKYMANLPLAHVYERNICLAVIFLGAKACFGNPYTLKDDLLLFKPHIVSLVPRMADRLHKALMEKASQLKGFKLALFNHAFKSKLNSVKKGVLTDMIYDKIVFNHFRNGVGGNLKFIVSGAAMADPTVCNALQALFSCRLIIGYGCSETCGAVTITHQDSTDMTHIGFPIMSIQTKLIDVPELNYKTDAEIPKGEL
jgi:long-chain acyl-CoA synthetase